MEGNQCAGHLAKLAQAKAIAGAGVYLSNPPLSLLLLLHEDSRECDIVLLHSLHSSCSPSSLSISLYLSSSSLFVGLTSESESRHLVVLTKSAF
ncbi:hypothetical protein CXB51_020318 [Gossypium anomalum]|uniref:Uncharacterized protein n=1 Tax=Gossypium anomalum TaxID=47600 RepID=A0A8J6CTG0_9ROSI|nr:hypothetical protein CXB51_020318 [Gossypium anomalum]